MSRNFFFGKLIIILIGISFFTCKKPKAVKPNDSNINPATSSHIVFIANEGNYGWGNGSLSVYDADKNQIDNNAYKDKNGQSVGDVFQSITLYNGKLYMVINNSGKLIVANADDLSHIADITGFTAPRYMQIVSSTKAYVSDMYANKLWIVNLSSNTISGNIPIHGWIEKMVYYNNKLYTSNEDSKAIYIINTQNDQITDSIMVNFGSAEMLLDKNNNLWVLSTGDTTSNIAPALQEINLTNNQILKTYTFAMHDSPFRLCYDTNQDCFYYLSKGNIYKLYNGDAALPTQAIIEGNGKVFYGLNVDNSNDDIYVSDAVDYTQKGWIYRYNSSFALVDSLQAGIIPSSFVFK